MRSNAASFFAAFLLAACGGAPSDLCGELVEDRETDSCRCPEGTEPGDDVWTCVLPDGGTIRDPNAPDAARDSGLDDAGPIELDSGTDAGVDAGADTGVDAGEPDGGCLDRVWFRDRDRDGFGVDDDSVTGCAAPDGYVAEGGDCDDECTACTPFASEICDERDNDCDGTPDEGLPQVTCYRDQDGDGFGRADTTMSVCGCPAGWTQRADRFDCHDQESRAHPEQTGYFFGVCPQDGPGCLFAGFFDFNCNGTLEGEFVHDRQCNRLSGMCSSVIAMSRPPCGASIEPEVGCRDTGSSCVLVTEPARGLACR
jgi:hypothetical protein